MKTHMNNTQSKLLDDVVSRKIFSNHQQALHSSTKPVVSTQRKQNITIVSNNKQHLNNHPNQQIKRLFNNLHNKERTSTLDNKNKYYEKDKKILKDKVIKNKFQKFAKAEHQRELIALKNRVQNCKNIQQRKKDNTDPLVNPVYFMRDQLQDAENVKLAKYSQKIHQMNKNKSYLTNTYSLPYHQGPKSYVKNETTYGHPMVPSYSKNRPQSAKQNVKMPQRPQTANNDPRSDLPKCTYEDILNHIFNNKIFKNTDLKVLYVRLCHKYEQVNVEGIWQSLMDQLQRDN